MAEHRLPHSLWILAALALLMPLHPARAQDGHRWTVTELAGQARLRGPDGAWHALARGAALDAGAAVETGADGKLVLLHDKDQVTVAPGSSFEIPRGDPATGASFLQRLGTMMYRIEHAPERHFEVDAPHLAAVVKGTVFTVSAGSEADSVHVAEGAVQVAAGVSHQVALVRPGQTAVVSAAGRDLTILGKTDAHPQHRTEEDLPDSAKGTSTASADPAAGHGAALTRTVGEEHVDIDAVTKGLIGDGSAARAVGRAAGRAADGAATGHGASGTAFAAGGNLFATAASSTAGGGNPNAGGGNPNAGGILNAHGGNPNAGGGNPNAGGGNPNAGGGNPNAGGGNPNAGGGNPNAGGGNPNAGGGNPHSNKP